MWQNLRQTTLFKSNRPYIKKEHESNLINYRPVSQVDSLYYHHVQSPLCDWLVDKLPMWMPPNVLTLTSFSMAIIPHLIIIAIYGNEMEGPIDRWVAVMCGIAYFIYTTIDNMDGK